MAMFEQANLPEQRNVIGDWALRGGVGLAFVAIGWEKFPAGTDWVGLFQAIGLGQWFRYFTGVVEIVGGLLVLVPRMAAGGLALLALTMLAASLIHIFVLGHPANAVITTAIALALGGFGWSRRDG